MKWHESLEAWQKMKILSLRHDRPSAKGEGGGGVPQKWHFPIFIENGESEKKIVPTKVVESDLLHILFNVMKPVGQKVCPVDGAKVPKNVFFQVFRFLTLKRTFKCHIVIGKVVRREKNYNNFLLILNWVIPYNFNFSYLFTQIQYFIINVIFQNHQKICLKLKHKCPKA